MTYALFFREPSQTLIEKFGSKNENNSNNEESIQQPESDEHVFDEFEGSGSETRRIEAPGRESASIEALYDDDMPDVASIDDLMKERSVVRPAGMAPLNLDFVFHNKVPKSGSSTMKHILQALSRRNSFELDHVRIIKFDSRDNDELVTHIKKFRKYHPDYPLVLLKHHTYVNFTKLNYIQPTYINVVRHPVGQFASFYYFKRYGWGFTGDKSDQDRRAWHGDEADRERSVDECVANKEKECMWAVGIISKYFCGTEHEFCNPHLQFKVEKGPDGENVRSTDWAKVSKATEQSKKNIIKNYYMIGVLEHFDSSLKLFEKMMPTIFTGATEAYHGEYVQKLMGQTKTKVSKGYSNSSLAIMEQVLRYDMDIYNLCKALFYQHAAYYNIPL